MGGEGSRCLTLFVKLLVLFTLHLRRAHARTYGGICYKCHFDYSIPRIVKTLCGVDEYTTCMAKQFWDPVTK